MDDLSFLDKYAQPKPVTTDYDGFIEESASKYGVDPDLIRLQMGTESAFKPKARSPKGASGLMQLMPGTARNLGVKDIYDPKQNIEGGVKYMRQLLDMFGGDVNLALAGYNAGEGAVQKYGNKIPPYKETRNYVNKIAGNYKGTGYHPTSLNFLDKYVDAPSDDTVVDAPVELDNGLSFLDKYVGDSTGGATTPPTFATPQPVSTDPVPETPDALQKQILSTFDANSPKSMTLLTNGNPANSYFLNTAEAKRLTRVNTPNGIVLVNTKKLGIKPSEATEYVKKNGFAQDSGFVIDMGNNTGDGQPAVAAIDPNTGKEVFAAVTPDPVSAQIQAQKNAAMFPGTVQVPTNTDEVVANRMAETQLDPNAIATAEPNQGGAYQGQPLNDMSQVGDSPEYADFLKQVGIPDSPEARAEFNLAQKASVEGANKQNRIDAVKQPSQPVIAQGKSVKPLTTPQSQKYADATYELPLSNKNGSYKSNYYDEVASRLSSELNVPYDVARSVVEQNPIKFTDGSEADDTYFAEVAKAGKSINAQIGGSIKRQIVDAAKQVADKQKLYREKLDEYAKTEAPSVADLLARKDAGLGVTDDEIKAERDAYQKALEEKGLTGTVQDPYAAGIASGELSPETRRAIRIDINAANADLEAKRQKFAQDILKDSGSFVKYQKDKERIKEEYANRPLAEPLEFAKNLAGAVPKALASVLKTGDLALNMHPLKVAYDQATGRGFKIDETSLSDIGNNINQFIEKNRNPDLKDKWYINMLPDTLGQLATQITAGVLSGGATLPTIIGASMGAASQYDEAKKFNADDKQKMTAAVVGALAAIPDALLFSKWFKGADEVAQTGFIKQLTQSLMSKLGVKYGEDVAAEVTKASIKQFAGNILKNAGFEGVQEVSENKINDWLALNTFDPSAKRREKLLSINDDDVSSFVGGLIGGAGGGAIETYTDNLAAKAQVDLFERSQREVDRLLEKGEITPAKAAEIKAVVAKAAEDANKGAGKPVVAVETVEPATEKPKAKKVTLEPVEDIAKSDKVEAVVEATETKADTSQSEVTAKPTTPSPVRERAKAKAAEKFAVKGEGKNGKIAEMLDTNIGAVDESPSEPAMTSKASDRKDRYFALLKNKDVNNRDFNKAVKYVADKNNPNTRAAFEQETGIALPNNNELSEHVIRAYGNGEPQYRHYLTTAKAKQIVGSNIGKTVKIDWSGRMARNGQKVYDPDPKSVILQELDGNTVAYSYPDSPKTVREQHIDNLRDITIDGKSILQQEQDAIGQQVNDILAKAQPKAEAVTLEAISKELAEYPSADRAFKAFQNRRDIPADVAQAFYDKYSDGGKLSQRESFDAFYKDTKAEAVKEPQKMRRVWEVPRGEIGLDLNSPFGVTLVDKQGEPLGNITTSQQGVEVRQPYRFKNLKDGQDRIEDTHRKFIIEALRQGEKVPAEVLADYPDLKARAERYAKESEKNKQEFAKAEAARAERDAKLTARRNEKATNLEAAKAKVEGRKADAVARRKTPTVPVDRTQAFVEKHGISPAEIEAQFRSNNPSRHNAELMFNLAYAEKKGKFVAERDLGKSGTKGEEAGHEMRKDFLEAYDGAKLTQPIEYYGELNLTPTKSAPKSKVSGVKSLETITTKKDPMSRLTLNSVIGEKGRLVATDGHRLLIVSDPSQKEQKWYDPKTGITVKPSGTFPNYEMVIPKDVPTSDSLPIQPLLDFAHRAIQVERNIDTRSPIQVHLNLNGETYAINAKYLYEGLRGLQANGGQNITIGADTRYTHSGVVFDDDAGNKYVVMPLDLKREGAGTFAKYPEQIKLTDPKPLNTLQRELRSAKAELKKASSEREALHPSDRWRKDSLVERAERNVRSLEARISNQSDTVLRSIPARSDVLFEGVESQSERALRSIPETDSLQGIITDRGIDYGNVENVTRGIRDGSLEIKRLDRQGEQGRIAGGKRNVESTLILAGNERASEEAGSRVEPYKRQEKLLEEYAKHEGIWLDPKEFNTERNGFISKGVEAYVHRSDDGSSVTKLIDYKMIDRHATPLDFIDNRISLFNYLFPGTPYELVGFTRDSKGDFRFIVKQRLIRDAVYTSPVERQAYMRNKGLDMTDKYGEAFANSLYKVHDLHEKNALIGKDGTIYVIDAVPKAKQVQPFTVVRPDEALRSVADIPQSQINAVKEVRNADGKLLAPNGKVSNLNERQWKEVRTPNFKNWFGDWEKAHNGKDGSYVWASDNVSKVVDENGEPKVVFHGTKKGGFTTFQTERNSKVEDTYWFTSDRDSARSYSGGSWEVVEPATDEMIAAWWNDEDGFNDETPYANLTEQEKKDARYEYEQDGWGGDPSSGVYPVFLNLRNPHEEYFEGANWDGSREGQWMVRPEDEDGDPVVYSDDGRGYFNDKDEAARLAAEKGGSVEPADPMFLSTDDAAREGKRYGDGTIIHEVVDSGSDLDYYDPVTVYVANDPKQIKSALFNNGNFDPNDPSILRKVAEQGDIADIEALGKGDFKELFNDIKSDVKSDANGANILDLGTNKTIELVRTAFAYMHDTPLEGTAIPGGMYLDPSQTNDFRDALQGIADAASEAGIESKGVDTLIKNLDKAAKDGDVRVIGFDNTLPHETIHQQSRRGAIDKELSQRYSDDGLGDDPVFKKFHKKLIEIQGKSSLAVAREEALAYLSSGDYARFGLTEAEATEIVARLIESYANKNGVDALKSFEGTTVYEQVENYYRKIESRETSNDSRRGVSGERETRPDTTQAERAENDTGERGETKQAKDLANDRRPGKSGLPFDEKEAREADAKGRKVAAISRIIGQEIYYDPQTNAETVVKAEQLTGRVGVQKAISDALTGKPSAEGMKVVYNEFSRLNALYDHFNDNGQEAEAIAIATELADLANAIQERQLATGQEAQIARTFDVLSPDIALLMAQRRIINKRGEGAKLTPEETAATIDAAKQLSKIEAQLEETRRKLRNSEAARRRLESDKEPRKRAATSQEKLLKEYQEQKTDLFAQLEKLFPDSPLFNGKSQALRMVAASDAEDFAHSLKHLLGEPNKGLTGMIFGEEKVTQTVPNAFTYTTRGTNKNTYQVDIEVLKGEGNTTRYIARDGDLIVAAAHVDADHNLTGIITEPGMQKVGIGTNFLKEIQNLDPQLSTIGIASKQGQRVLERAGMGNEILRSVAETESEPLDPLKQEVLTKWATGQILEGLPYEALIKTLEQFGISQAEAQQIHSNAVDVIKPAREPRTAEAKEKTQIRNEHYREAKAFVSDGKPQLSGIAQDAQEDAKYKDDPKLIEVIDYLTNVNTAKAGRSLNQLINGIRKANPEMSISDAERLAGRAQQAVTDLRIKRKRAADKAKNISEDARQEINRLTVEKRRASRRMSDHLKQLGRGTEWAMHRFNNLMRAAFVNNWVTQLFNGVQSTVVATPTQMALDGITQLMLRGGLNIGENTEINLKDILLPEAYIFANNRQLAEHALAHFPEEYFRIHAGILGDIEIDKVAQADTAHWLTKPLHQVFDKADKATDVLSKVSLSKVQEMYFRNAIIGARFDQFIRAKSNGTETLESALKNGEFTKLVTEKDATRIADDALEVTFASEINDPIGKKLKKAYDTLDNFVPIFLNPVTFARFTYTTTKVMVANPLLFGAMDAKAAGGRGYNTKSVAKGVLAWSGVAAAYALTSALGGDDDRWDTLYVFGKDQPPLSIKRFFPLSAYFYVAHLIRQYKEGGTPPTMTDLLEGFMSLETEYYTYGPGLGLADAVKRAAYDGTGSKEEVGRASARMMGNFFGGLLSVLKPAKLALSAIDDEEATLRDDSDTAKEKFISEISRAVPGIIRLSDAPKKIDPLTDKPILQPWILGRAVGLNFVHPSFLSNKDSAATQWANRLFAYEGGSSKMSAEDRNAYFIKKRLKEAMRRGEIDLTTANEKAVKYLAKVLTPESMKRLEKELQLSELQSKVKAGFSQPDDPKKAAKELRDLRVVWNKATDQEKEDIRKVLANKRNLSSEFIEEFGVTTTKQAKMNKLPDNLESTFDKLGIKPPGVGGKLGKSELTPEQKEKYERETIERIEKKVESLQSKPAYKNADDALRKKMVEGIIRKQRAEEAAETKKEMSQRKLSDAPKGYNDKMQAQASYPWPTFEAELPPVSPRPRQFAGSLRNGRQSENVIDRRDGSPLDKFAYQIRSDDLNEVKRASFSGGTRAEREEAKRLLMKEIVDARRILKNYKDEGADPVMSRRVLKVLMGVQARLR